MRLAFLGSGQVGAPLAQRLAQAGHEVVLAAFQEGSASLDAALARTPLLRRAPALAAVEGAEVIFLTTPFGANEAVLAPLAGALAGKVLVDCTNPVGPGLSHGLRSERSGSEAVQAMVPGARVVKAFSIYGAENLEEPDLPGGPGTMLFCGEDPAAKALVARLIQDVGFAPLDVGGLAQALHLEHMTLLWVRLVRANGHPPALVWRALTKA